MLTETQDYVTSLKQSEGMEISIAFVLNIIDLNVEETVYIELLENEEVGCRKYLLL